MKHIKEKIQTSFKLPYNKQTIVILASCDHITNLCKIHNLELSFYTEDGIELVDIPYSKRWFELAEDDATDALYMEAFGEDDSGYGEDEGNSMGNVYVLN